MDDKDEMRAFDELELENVAGGYNWNQFMNDMADFCKTVSND